MKAYIKPNTQAMPVATKDFLCQAVTSPAPGGPIVKGQDVINGGSTGYNPGGGL